MEYYVLWKKYLDYFQIVDSDVGESLDFLLSLPAHARSLSQNRRIDYTRASHPTGSWWFSGSPSGSDSNFLRVVSSFPNRRLSDNMLNTPKIRVAPSCASSPGSTPVGTGLPIRRHSNVERRGSTINLSPPSVIYVYIYIYSNVRVCMYFTIIFRLYLSPPKNTHTI